MEVFLIRHGETAGNRERRYISATDEPLSPSGRQAVRQTGVFAQVEQVYVSPLKRAGETARLLFPQARLTVVDDLREMDFGRFEGCTADELQDDPGYWAWLDSACSAPCPGGESVDAFTRRTCSAFDHIVRAKLANREQRLVIVAHGGSIMAIMSRYARPPRPYFDWRVGNACAYHAQLDAESWQTAPALTACRLMEELCL